MSYVVWQYIPNNILNVRSMDMWHQYVKGSHEYGKCEEGVKPRCCSCGGEHSVGFGGCQVRINVVKVQNMKVTEGLMNVEAIK